jgi:hypothetical protein
MHEEDLEDFEYEFEPEDIKAMVAEALDGKAVTMEDDASKESMLGAANITKVNYLRWAATEFRAFADLVRAIPESETRQRPVPERPTPEDLEPPVPEDPEAYIAAVEEAIGDDEILDGGTEEETVEQVFLENPPEAGGSTVVGSKRHVRKSDDKPV